ncbi:MAG TPA: hypothetical protein VEH29_02525 [Acidimicrobiales bacterium]|nr:hypothetical protein [Acidimicrobiales bacterium]
MSRAPDRHAEPGAPLRRRLWDHIGVISGVVLGLVVLAFVVVLAEAGDPGALQVIVVVVVGVALIYFGGRLHGLRSRH